ncbi:MAG: TetR/AcrR family transcriptional regulator [Clostridiaceae bacterium]|nr:TetR/AcrR family transcriptional regulator [Clostridiaceae bacterium]
MRQSDDSPIREERRARNSPRRPRITKEPEARRQEIIETALELLAEKGYENMTVQDITDRMNVSPGLCYRYFKSKTEIFSAASEYYAMKMVEQLKIPISKDVPVIEKLELVINRIFEFAMSHHDFESRYNEGEDIRAIYLDNVAEQWAAVLLPIIEQGVNEKVFQSNDVSATTHFLIFGLVHTFHQKIPSQNTKDYMVTFLDFTHDMFSRVLGLSRDFFQ